jgi:hypothetical protein
MGEYSKDQKDLIEGVLKPFNRLLLFLGAIVLVVLIYTINPDFFKFLDSEDKGEITELKEVIDADDLIENGIHISSGLIVDEGYELVVNTCGSCHSFKLVTQNKGNKEDWRDIIHWMQKTQKLWDLGPTEDPIVIYLAKNYGPTQESRRSNLTNIQWYELE